MHLFGHFLAGAAMAAFLIPEGALATMLGVAAAAIVKCLYDYFDAGRVRARNAGSIVAGGVAGLMLSIAWPGLS